MPIAVLIPQLVAFFDGLASMYGGILGRIVVAAIQRIILREIADVAGSAKELLDKDKLPAAVADMRTWLHERIRGELPRWFHWLFCPNKSIDKVCNFMIEHKDELLAVAAAKAAVPPAK